MSLPCSERGFDSLHPLQLFSPRTPACQSAPGIVLEPPVLHRELLVIEPLISLRQQARQQCRPLTLTFLVRDKILANLKLHMMQGALFTVDGDGVIRLIR